MYILLLWNTILLNLVFLTWYQSHCSDHFLAVLSLLVLLYSQHRFCHHNSHCILSPLNLWHLPTVVLGFRTCSCCHWVVPHHKDHCLFITVENITPINFLQVPLRSSCADLLNHGSLEAIGAHTCPHALLKGSALQLIHRPMLQVEATRDVSSAT